MSDKFVQICAVGNRLYALDAAGGIWLYTHDANYRVSWTRVEDR